MASAANNDSFFSSIPPWVWVTVLPFVSILIVCGTLIGFSVIGADDPVKDNYYKEGRMINLHLAADAKAAALGVKGQLTFDFSTKKIKFKMQRVTLDNTEMPENQLRLQLLHPLSSDKDLQLMLALSEQKLGTGTSVFFTYVAPMKENYDGRWYVQIDNAISAATGQSGSESGWRIKGEMNFKNVSSLYLESSLVQ